QKIKIKGLRSRDLAQLCGKPQGTSKMRKDIFSVAGIRPIRLNYKICLCASTTQTFYFNRTLLKA
ncbi:MAG: hypothetical protein RR875_02615, partial [Clostridium sp.]